jgi:hypothetical protein
MRNTHVVGNRWPPSALTQSLRSSTLALESVVSIAGAGFGGCILPARDDIQRSLRTNKIVISNM